MNTTLAIVGCGPRLEVALRIRHIEAPGLVVLAGPTPRSDLIMAAVELLVRAAGLAPADIEAVVATRGPGSFTGIRVALATAQGLAAALGIPAVGLPSLLVQAARTVTSPVLAAQPARRGHLYVQEFRREDHNSLPVAAGEVRVVALNEFGSLRLPLVAPSGVELPPGAATAPVASASAEALLDVAARLAAADPDSLVPIYVEPPPAVPPNRTAKPWPPSPTTS